METAKISKIAGIRRKYLGNDSLQVVFDVESTREAVRSLLFQAQRNAKEAQKDDGFLPKDWKKDILRSVAEQERQLKLVQGFVNELTGMLSKAREAAK